MLPDDVLVGLVGLRPKTVEELSQLRRLDAGMRKHIGTRIIAAVAAGEAIPEDELPPRAPRPLGAQRDALVAAIALLINAVAAANDLPAALLVSRAEIERDRARAAAVAGGTGRAARTSRPWRRDLVVEPLWQFLSGERVLRIAGYRDGAPRTTWETGSRKQPRRRSRPQFAGGEGRSM